MTPLFSTAYFPSIAYMAYLKQFDRKSIFIDLKETYPKQTYRNRMEILSANGILTLTVPVIRNNHTRTEDVKIDYKERWNIIHWRTIKTAYASSPYFLHYQDELETLLTTHYSCLAELNEKTLTWILKAIKTNINIQYTSDFIPYRENQEDYRDTFSPKKHNATAITFKPYYQVFSDRHPFHPNLSVLDLLMNLGPEAKDYLDNITIKG